MDLDTYCFTDLFALGSWDYKDHIFVENTFQKILRKIMQ